jgi:hypothetical protein
MSCLSVKINKATENFSVGLDRIAGGKIIANAQKATPSLSVVLSLVPRFNVACTLLGERLKVAAGIICTLSEVKKWLKVSPNEIQWITEDTGVYFDVVSNVEWIIVTD